MLVLMRRGGGRAAAVSCWSRTSIRTVVRTFAYSSTDFIPQLFAANGNSLHIPEFYSGAARPPGRFIEGLFPRRLHEVGIFPNEEAVAHLVDALLLEQNGEWTVQRARYMSLETIAPLSDDPAVSLLVPAD